MSRSEARIVPVSWKNVTLAGAFWGGRLAANRRVTLPLEYDLCRRTGRIDALRLGWKPGQPNPPHIFWDSDIAKWIEAAAYSLATHPDPELETRVDGVIELLANAQLPDGYLNSHFIAVEPDKRWSNLRDCHELYCAGHLIEAAVAYAEATGKRAFLEIMSRYADHIASVFGRGPGQKRGYCGHPEIELALVKLYRATGNRQYLEQSAYFIDERGREPHYFDLEARARGELAGRNREWHGDAYEVLQAHQPVRDQTAIEGHAVRAMYLACGMADVAAETGDAPLAEACRRLWRNMVDRRMYITGGIGSSRRGERFTFDYDLPNATAYAETCAAIGVVFWAHRMLQLEANAEYADVMERALYNGVASGVSLNGTHFFYANPLAAVPALARFENLAGHVAISRQEWFDCACCPPNVARLFASLGQYVYGQRADTAFVHLYIAGAARLEVGGRHLLLRQTTGYPWKERVRIEVLPKSGADSAKTPARFVLALRLPGWCREPEVAVNGRRVSLRDCVRQGYAYLDREWRRGDSVEVRLPMPVERILAHPEVRQDAGRLALQRGPLVYCLEEADNGPGLNGLCVPRAAKLAAIFDRKLLGGTVVIRFTARRQRVADWQGRLYQPADRAGVAPVKITAIPYCQWGNRVPGEMLVWLPAMPG